MSICSSDSDSTESWIEWFCSLQGREYYCQVERSYIEDAFNLYGLRAIIPNYQDALETILDRSDSNENDEEASNRAMDLYGMIHARYIITSRGLEVMAQKYQRNHFGVCPRALCSSQPVVPAGIYDEVGKAGMRVFCPKCCDLYSPSYEAEEAPVDGAHFGTTFPHLLFMTYKELEPTPSVDLYIPRVFGYRVRNKGPRRERLAATSNTKQNDKSSESTDVKTTRLEKAGKEQPNNKSSVNPTHTIVADDPTDQQDAARGKKRKANM